MGENTGAQYPEHDKLRHVADDSQAIGKFIDLSGYVLCQQDDFGTLCAVQEPINEILAGYFEIDLKALDREKAAMLAAMQEAQA